MRTITGIGRLTAAVLIAASGASAQVVINEFTGEVTGDEDWEFVELYNAGGSDVDISGWVIGSRDTLNQSGLDGDIYTVDPGTTIPAGGFFTIGTAGAPNLDQTVVGAAPDTALGTVTNNLFENRNETIELHNADPTLDGTDSDDVITLVDAVYVEAWRGPADGGSFPLPFELLDEIGFGRVGYGIFDSCSSAGATGGQRVAYARLTDGADTDLNSADFVVRPATPGTSNTAFDVVTELVLPNPSDLSPGSTVAGFDAANYVAAQVVDPTVALGSDTLNPDALPAPPAGGNAIAVGDPTGGAAIAISDDIFSPARAGDTVKFEITAYLNTAATPDGSGESDYTAYGLGTPSIFMNRADPAGLLAGLQVAAMTGVAWYHQRDEDNNRLILVESTLDGAIDKRGNADPVPFPPFEDASMVLADVDLLTLGLPSGWYDLSIEVDTSGNVLARFGGAPDPAIGFVDPAIVDGSFFAAYNEVGAGGITSGVNSPALFVPRVTVPGCLADLNGDGVADYFDIAIFKNLGEAGDPSTDLDESGGYNDADLLSFVELVLIGC